MEKSRTSVLLMYAALAAAALAVVALFGWLQFSRRPAPSIDTVRRHEIPGTGTSIGEGILEHLRSRDKEVVTDGFKPSWGAEEKRGGAWIVSYVYEAGREARWVSWRVYPETGRVVPLDDIAAELW